MLLETGVDSIEIERIKEAIERHGDRFLERIYTPGELASCHGRAESLAARFAAKEAAFKVLGMRVGWRDVEVMRLASGKPRLVLHGRGKLRAEHMGLNQWSVSLTHDRTHAIAMVVAHG